MRLQLIAILFISHFSFSCNQAQEPVRQSSQTTAVPEQLEPYFIDMAGDTIYRIFKTDPEWKEQLGQMQYFVLREAGTERAFTGHLLENKKKGVYTCAACGLPLFASDAKFDSGSGWPSYYQPIDPTHIIEREDNTNGWNRVELLCARCGGHLGHVFDDGPKPTGLRYCINSVSLDFVPNKK